MRPEVEMKGGKNPSFQLTDTCSEPSGLSGGSRSLWGEELGEGEREADYLTRSLRPNTSQFFGHALINNLSNCSGIYICVWKAENPYYPFVLYLFNHVAEKVTGKISLRTCKSLKHFAKEAMSSFCSAIMDFASTVRVVILKLSSIWSNLFYKLLCSTLSPK